jgi:cupin 2 domain-containing protein
MDLMLNLLRDLPDAREAEVAETLFAASGLHVERIVSLGQASPPGFWYDQNEAEWVLLLAGAARLRFEDEGADRVLAPGDHITIAPHRRHRVEWTDPDTPTVWLAVFYGRATGTRRRRRNAPRPASAAPTNASDAGSGAAAE